jgi:hypothetical protein
MINKYHRRSTAFLTLQCPWAKPRSTTPSAPCPARNRGPRRGRRSANAPRPELSAVAVVTAPDGWPIWTSPVRPGREHDTTALRAHPEALPLLAEWTDTAHAVLGDLGCEGEQAALTTNQAALTIPSRGAPIAH